MIRYEKVMDRYYIAYSIEAENKGFEISMLMNNDIDGLIKPQLWSVNGRREYRFDITGKKSFGDIMKERLIGENELRILFSGIVRILDSVREYLISAEIILLQPDFIYFTDFGVEFVFDISKSKDFNKELLNLVKSILNRLDYNDRAAAERAYQIFDIVSMGKNSMMRELAEIFETKDINRDCYNKYSSLSCFCDYVDTESYISDSRIHTLSGQGIRLTLTTEKSDIGYREEDRLKGEAQAGGDGEKCYRGILRLLIFSMITVLLFIMLIYLSNNIATDIIIVIGGAEIVSVIIAAYFSLRINRNKDKPAILESEP